MRALASAFSIRRGRTDDGASPAAFNTSSANSPANAPPPRNLAKARSTALFAKAPKTPLETLPSPLPASSSPYVHLELHPHPNPDSPHPTLTPASSSSSNESASIRTPDDDGQMSFPAAATSHAAKRTDEKKKWSSWFGLRKLSVSDKGSSDGHRAHAKAAKERSQSQKHHHERKVQQRARQERRQTASDTDDDSDDDSDSSESHTTVVLLSSAPSRNQSPIVITQAALAAAQNNLRFLIRNTLTTPQYSPPPLVLLPSFPSLSSPYASSSPSLASSSPYSSLSPPLSSRQSNPRPALPPRFPRSTAPHLTSPFTHTFETTLHLRRMMRRLERRNLTHAEARSIAAFGARSVPPLNTPTSSGSTTSVSTVVPDNHNGSTAKKSDDDADAISEAFKRVVSYSRGLRIWCNRPCFEERMDVWMPLSDEGSSEAPVVRSKVMGVGRGLAVTELEFSEGLEYLAGLALDDATFERELLPPPPPQPRSDSFARNALQKSVSSLHENPRRPAFMSSPSPLRLEQLHGEPAKPVLSLSSASVPAATPSNSARKFSSATPDLREVRFAEDTRDNEDKAPGRGRGVFGFSLRVGDRSREQERRERDKDKSDKNIEDKDKDADDDVPLGYAIQAKKKREEKERFLQVERAKRAEAQEGERKREEERRRRAEEEERRREIEDEVQRRLEEERRRKAEEEKRKERYAEEVVAARQRREMIRSGSENFTTVRENRLREREPSYTRPRYDTNAPSSASPQAHWEAGPGNDSAAGSISGRRTSFYTGSSEDVRRSAAAMQDGFASAEDLRPPGPPSRRQSSISISSQQGSARRRPISVLSTASDANTRRMSLPRAQTAPAPAPQVVAVPYPVFLPNMGSAPPVPPLPMWNMNMGGMGGLNGVNGLNMANLNMNMPLLPPAPPFMMQQYRGSGSSGGGGSRSGSPSGSHSPSASGSRTHSRDSSPSHSRRSSGIQIGYANGYANGSGYTSTPNSTPPTGSPARSNVSLPAPVPAPAHSHSRSRQSIHAGDHSPRQSSHLSRDITPSTAGALPSPGGPDADSRRYSRLSIANVNSASFAPPPPLQLQHRQASSSSVRAQAPAQPQLQLQAQTQAQVQARQRKTSQGSSSTRKPEPKRRTTMV